MDADFPAAHSMDATWFAVDRDGHVAMFDTGEAGAVPISAEPIEDPTAVLTSLASAFSTEVIHDLQGRLQPGEREVPHFALQFGDRAGAALFFLKSLDPVKTELEQRRGVAFPAVQGHAVALFHAATPLVRQLHQDGLCLGCFWYYHNPTGVVDEEERLRDVARLGIFSYSHLTENWISGPYGREKLPRTPLHVEQLPPEVRRTVKQMKFGTLCFAETPHIQPAEFDDCTSWEHAYLSSDGKTIRAIPGNATYRFEDVCEQLRELQAEGLPEGMTVEMPKEP
ncbi:MAG: hypothetical protein JNM56_37055 [Planctomycetia bacterium]|nr:hypothetical protein [Planctomycetia bacterium]